MNVRRRTFLIGSAALAGSLALPRSAQAATRRVAIFGGGMGGLTAAHELAERGFDVTIYERKAWGGKSRSFPTAGAPPLPAEHGFRFFPGFYQNLPDTMSRVPLPGGGTAFDNLATGSEITAYYAGKQIILPAQLNLSLLTPESINGLLRTAFNVVTEVPATELIYFTQKLLVFLTSGPQRRLKQWENVSFAKFVGSATMSQAYRELLVDLVTGTLVAAKPDKANSRTMGLMAEAWVYSTLGLGGYKAPDRLLNAPTNEALIDPWIAHLKSLNVKFELGTLTGLTTANGSIASATVNGSTVTADYYVLAMPVERAVPVLNDDILAIDPALRSLRNLTTDWMNGVMIYLKKPVDLSHGHVAYGGQPWALTSISQAQFWKRNFGTTYGNGEVNDCLSIDLSAWDVPGMLYGKAARDCTSEQIFAEVIGQIRKALPAAKAKELGDDNIHSYYLDPAITGNGTPQVANDEPLLINLPSSWNYRPEATTKLPNLFLAADYVRNSINLATMEGANEAGRMAANAILKAAGTGTPARLFTLYQPKELAGVHASDDQRFALGLPNAFDIYDPIRP